MHHINTRGHHMRRSCDAPHHINTCVCVCVCVCVFVCVCVYCLLGTFLSSKAVLPYLRKSKNPHILNIRSSPFTHTHTHTHTHTDTHTHTHRHTRTHRHTQTETHTHTDTRTHTDTHTQTHAHTHRHTHTQEKKEQNDKTKKNAPACFQMASQMLPLEGPFRTTQKNPIIHRIKNGYVQIILG